MAHKIGEIKQLTDLVNQKESDLFELHQKIIHADYQNTVLQNQLDKAKEEINQIKSQHDMKIRKINANAESQNDKLVRLLMVKRSYPLAIIFIILMAIITIRYFGVLINITPSMELGFYRKSMSQIKLATQSLFVCLIHTRR